jgi:subtilase family serine protease
MKTNPLSILSLTITAPLFFLAPSAPAAPLQTLSGHVPAAVAHLQPTGRLPATNRLHLAVALAPRNRDGLEKLLRDQQDPQSPSYHQYLSLEEFTSRFGPTERDYQKAMDFAQANGLKVSGRYANRIILDVEGAVTDVEKALHGRPEPFRLTGIKSLVEATRAPTGSIPSAAPPAQT